MNAGADAGSVDASSVNGSSGDAGTGALSAQAGPRIEIGRDGKPLALGLPAISMDGNTRLSFNWNLDKLDNLIGATLWVTDFSRGLGRSKVMARADLRGPAAGWAIAVAPMRRALASVVKDRTFVPLIDAPSTGSWSQFDDGRLLLDQVGDLGRERVQVWVVDELVADVPAPWLHPRMPGYLPSCTDGVEIMDVEYSLAARLVVLLGDVDGTGCPGVEGEYVVRWKKDVGIDHVSLNRVEQPNLDVPMRSLLPAVTSGGDVLFFRRSARDGEIDLVRQAPTQPAKSLASLHLRGGAAPGDELRAVKDIVRTIDAREGLVPMERSRSHIEMERRDAGRVSVVVDDRVVHEAAVSAAVSACDADHDEPAQPASFPVSMTLPSPITSSAARSDTLRGWWLSPATRRAVAVCQGDSVVLSW